MAPNELIATVGGEIRNSVNDNGPLARLFQRQADRRWQIKCYVRSLIPECSVLRAVAYEIRRA